MPDRTGHTTRLLCLDFDGTLVDTRPLWEAAYRQVARARKQQLPPNWWPLIAGKSMTASAVVFDAYQPDEQAEVASQLVATAMSLAGVYPPIVLPGAHELVARAAHARVPACIVTSTWTALASRLAAAAGFSPLHVTGGDEVENGKPDPAIYWKACATHGTLPQHATAVEDSPSGIAAAFAAGLFVYALGDHVVTDRTRQRQISHLDAVTFVADAGSSAC
jgi:HAD superfamily hydrolase (TIGR01509 family)